MSLDEAVVEQAALSWFDQLGYAAAHAPYLAPGEIAAERKSFAASDAREEALRKVLRHDAPSVVGNNRVFHRILRDGVPVEYRRDDGSIAGDHARLIDFDNPGANDWLAVNQFAVVEGQNNLPVRGLPVRSPQTGTQTGRRPDIVVFVNGLPLGIIELKIPEDTDK